MNRQPVALGLLLCEQVIVEERTRNVTPVNCFTRRSVEAFPTGPMPLVVFAILTDGSGEMPLDVVFHKLDDFEEIYRYTIACRFKHPSQNVRCMLRIADCAFPAAGHYQVSLLAQGGIVAQRMFAVDHKEKQA